MSVDWVVFDVGETLVDESRAWLEHAAASGVPPFTLMGVLGGLAARGEHHKRVWEIVGAEPVPAAPIDLGDFYPDALPCLRALRQLGLRLGLVGNQPEQAAAELEGCGLDVDLIATSAGWGVEKPSPAFFERLVAEVGVPPEKIAYVGDRVDNDIVPVLAAGMVAVHVRRGPWGFLHDAPEGAIRVDSLAELPQVLAGPGFGSVPQ
jgi:HAD superfamily hydrolase (TIGR01509 family)